MPCSPTDITLEHIDPRNHPLVSGLQIDLNEILAEGSYNYGKGNKFVPYRVSELPAPVNPGDLGEFLIRGSWHVCRFFDEWWNMEAVRILVERGARGGPPRVDWEKRLRQVEREWNCHIIICSPDGRLTKGSTGKRKCKHGLSKEYPIGSFLVKNKRYCCIYEGNRQKNINQGHTLRNPQ